VADESGSSLSGVGWKILTLSPYPIFWNIFKHNPFSLYSKKFPNLSRFYLEIPPPSHLL